MECPLGASSIAALAVVIAASGEITDKLQAPESAMNGRPKSRAARIGVNVRKWVKALGRQAVEVIENRPHMGSDCAQQVR